ncbi:MAG: VCBS repeat-containing protein, partial [Candidatus Kapabacteria bacterium]|nr:VCBS repeat-containing protein [Candidatus Kapabacteria bacterium]
MNYVFVILLTASTLLAQIPNPKSEVQSVPVLQEWWRADNMGYGINGMTWLDNFYNGKGALVISTPNGVQTWQLRYPWDTVNVFTWGGGDANIKTGDFNGDGVMDYLDDKGNIYVGTENGKPPLPSDTKINHQIGQRRVIVTDINKDGKSDILSFASTIYPSKIFGQVFFGTTNIKNILSKSIYQSGTIDTNSSAYCIYENSKKEIRLINRYYQKGSSDGYTLYSVSINNIDSTPVLNKLHEYFVSDRQETCGRTNALITDDTKHTIHWVALEMINERRELTNVTAYDLTNDTFNKLYSVRMDSVSTIEILTKSINNDNVIDLSIRKMQIDGISEFNTYSGILQNKLMQISSNLICQRTYLTSISDMNNNGVNEIAFSGNTGSCFSILLGQHDTTLNIHNNEYIFPNLIKVLEYKQPFLTISI